MLPSRNCVRSLLVTCVVLAVSELATGQQLLRTHAGGAAGDAFGTARPAGDVNDDGEPDLIVGAPHDATAAGADVGSARVISGASGGTLFQFTGDAAGDLFGWSCASAGDVNADGHDDVIVGAPGSPGSSAPGYVRIFSGASGATLRTITGNQAGGAFGTAVSGGRDLDADGKADVIVGAPLQDHGGADTGSAYAFSGADGSVLNGIDGSGAGDRLGSSLDIHFTGTQMTDNEPSVIIGCTQGGNGGAGQVLVLVPSTFAVAHTFSGAAAGAALGTCVAIAGDVNDDGTADIIGGSDPAGAGTGSARVWSGTDFALLLTLNGAQAGTGFARMVAAVGDVNGDGKDDVAVGEPLADGNGTDAGSIRVYSGANGSELYHVHGPAAGARFGSAIAFAGDISGDALADFAVGVPGDDAAGTDAGTVFVLSLTRWENLGSGLPGVNGVPRLEGQGGLVAQTQASLSLTGARPVAGATLVLGSSLHVDGASGVLLPVADIVTTGLITSGSGDLNYGFAWPTGIPSGFTCYYQFVISDPDGPGGQSRSNTVAAKVP